MARRVESIPSKKRKIWVFDVNVAGIRVSSKVHSEWSGGRVQSKGCAEDIQIRLLFFEFLLEAHRIFGYRVRPASMKALLRSRRTSVAGIRTNRKTVKSPCMRHKCVVGGGLYA